jgi:thermitase
VQTTFVQFLSIVHEARVTGTLDTLSDRLTSSKSRASGSSEGGFFIGLFGFGGSSSDLSQSSVTNHNMMRVNFISDQFNQSVILASQLTHAERSLVISTFEDKETQDLTSRNLHNDNTCRAVNYFVRQVVELYAVSTMISEISYRIIAPNLPTEWHSLDDIGWAPKQIQNEIRNLLRLLPRVGEITERAKPISLPTDGVVYDPELAHCCSCEPEREAAIAIQLEKQKAESLKACLEAQILELELQRRRMLLQRGELDTFDKAKFPNSSSQVSELGISQPLRVGI